MNAKLALAAGLVLSACVAQASTPADVMKRGSFQCNSTIKKLLIYADGSVNVNLTVRGDFTYVCNLRVTRKGVDPATCAMWTDVMQTQMRAGLPIELYYYGDATFSSCEEVPYYDLAPAPVYIGAPV